MIFPDMLKLEMVRCTSHILIILVFDVVKSSFVNLL